MLNLKSQLTSQSGMGRPGGAPSRGSTPNVNQGTGSSFAAMENALLKTPKPNPKKLAKGKSTRQFQKLTGQ